MLNDTIIALSSGYVKAAISVIRVSGSNSFSIVNEIFTNKKEKEHQKIYYGNIVDDGNIVDEVMVAFFKGPHSFTAEDMVEISCHGNMLIVNKILKLLIKHGARLAERGEFTKRAFLFNRIDLVNAEAVNDLINATSDASINLAMSALKGKTSTYVENLSDKLLDVISQIEVNIDYPEYDDIEQLRYDSVLPSINGFLDDLNKVIDDTRKGNIIKDGIDTVIVGKPNVGKSSLLNAMIKEDKAIVTEIAGTTRDIVEGKIEINGITLNLIDTAGIHESNDKIEKIGINKSLEYLDKAKLVLVLLDGSKPLDDDDRQILEKTKTYNRIIILNKDDIGNNVFVDGAIKISALNHDIEELENKIKELFANYEYNNEPILFNARQLGLLERAKRSLLQAKSEAENGQVIDIISIPLKEAYDSILEILGRKGDFESFLSSIFSKFCLGK